MAVLIGHASMDENGSATGGTAGDQTRKELCTRQWYTKGWNLLLRPKTAILAEASARACEAACENSCIGYDQGGRNTLYAKAKAVSFDLAAISTGCECDCSSLMHVCAIAGDADIPYDGNGCTTRTMASAFVASGAYEKLTDSKYLDRDDYLRRGDILVKEGSHTVMVLSSGAEAELVPPAAGTTPPATEAPGDCLCLPLLQAGAKSDPVKAMQQLLFARGYDLPRTGIFEEITEAAVVQFQRDMGLAPDGKCGRDVWSALLGLTGVG